MRDTKLRTRLSKNIYFSRDFQPLFRSWNIWKSSYLNVFLLSTNHQYSSIDSQSKFQIFTLFSRCNVGVPRRNTNMAAPYWALLFKFVQNISSNIWSLEKRTDLKLGEVSSLSTPYNITVSQLHPQNGFRIIIFFLLLDSASKVYNTNWLTNAIRWWQQLLSSMRKVWWTLENDGIAKYYIIKTFPLPYWL